MDGASNLTYDGRLSNYREENDFVGLISDCREPQLNYPDIFRPNQLGSLVVLIGASDRATEGEILWETGPDGQIFSNFEQYGDSGFYNWWSILLASANSHKGEPYGEADAVYIQSGIGTIR